MASDSDKGGGKGGKASKSGHVSRAKSRNGKQKYTPVKFAPGESPF